MSPAVMGSRETKAEQTSWCYQSGSSWLGGLTVDEVTGCSQSISFRSHMDGKKSTGMTEGLQDNSGGKWDGGWTLQSGSPHSKGKHLQLEAYRSDGLMAQSLTLLGTRAFSAPWQGKRPGICGELEALDTTSQWRCRCFKGPSFQSHHVSNWRMRLRGRNTCSFAKR